MIMKAKKLLSIILVGVSAVSLLAGCSLGTGSQDSSAEETAGGTQEESSEETAQSVGQEPTEEAQTDTQGDTEESAQETGTSDTSGARNVLVVYYSATGNTENVANIIAETTDGDLFALEPVEPYTEEDLNYGDDNSRVSREHEDESLRDVELASTTVDNWDSYDTVFIGYPKIQYGFLSV